MRTIGETFPVRLLRYLVLELRSLWARRTGAWSGSGRGSQRYRRAAFGGVTIVLYNGLKMLGSLAVVPLVLHYIGAERFGLWVTLTSLLAVIGLGDLGIGNGLINALSTAHGTDDRASARTYVSSAFFMVLAFCAIFLGVLLVLDAVVPWPTVFNLSSPKAIAEVGPAIKVVIICIVLHVLFGVLIKVRTAHQEVYISSLWDTSGVILGLAALVALVLWGASLPWLILAETGVPILAMMGNIACLFLVERAWLRPAWNWVSFDAMRSLFSLGILFFILQVTAIVGLYSDNLLAIWTCGPEAVGLYAITVKLFGPSRLLASTLTSPLWPAYGEAIARGDIAWVRRTLVGSITAAALVVLPLGLVGLLFGSELASFWLQRPISLGYGLLAGMALWVVLEAIGSGLNIFLNGASAIRVQIPVSVSFAVVAVALKVILANQFGIGGIIWGTVLAYSGTVLLPYARIIPRHMRELARRNAATAPSLLHRAGVAPSE